MKIKKFYLLIIILILSLISLNLFAQKEINFQGVVADSQDQFLEGEQTLEFNIYSVSSGGVSLWSETHTLTLSEGLFSVNLGSTNQINLDFSQQLWVGISINGDAELSPRTQLTYSPYSMYAVAIGNNAVNSAKIEDGTVGELDLSDGSVTGLKIQDGTIENIDLDDSSVNSAKIENSSITNEDLSDMGAGATQFMRWDGTQWSPSDETDPIFTNSPANGISNQNITNWDAAFGWGNHAEAGYLTTVADETDPTWSGDADINSTISRNGNVGIGTDSPTSLLHTEGTGTGEGNILFKGERKTTNPGDPPAEGSGTRMMWYPDKAAFRAGFVSDTQWDKDEIGLWSMATGVNTIASGHNSIALGQSTTASDTLSFALGFLSTASSDFSIAMGYNSEASGLVSVSIGNESKATANYSTSFGYFTTASGWNSTTMGANTTAASAFETVVGRYNTDYTPVSISDWNSNDRLFVVGNGTTNRFKGLTTIQKSNALTILKNGNTGIGTDLPQYKLHIKSPETQYHTALFIEASSLFSKRAALGIDDWSLLQDIRGDGVKNFAIYQESAFSQRFVIDENGNVGIGTNAPTEKLSVVGNSYFDGKMAIGYQGQPPGAFFFEVVSNSNSKLRVFDFDAALLGEWSNGGGNEQGAIVRYTGFHGDDSKFWELGQLDNNSFTIRGGNDGSFYILEDGSTGIGTDTPTALLHTEGTGTGGGNVLFSGSFKSVDPGDPAATGAGTRMMWYPDKAAFRVGQVVGNEWDKDYIGNNSFATGFGTTASGAESFTAGYGNTASGVQSFAVGFNNTASGENSVVMGQESSASGNFSFAFGDNAISSGEASVAIGGGTEAKSQNEIVLGLFNTDYTPNNTDFFNPDDRLFVIANGTGDLDRSNALTIMKNGNTGIGIDAPTALLHTEGTGTGEGNVLFAGSYKSVDPGDPAAEGAGTRMMWYPDKSSFRVGGVTGTQWDKVNIGITSVAMGFNTTASGNYSTAMGNGTNASGFYSFAIGASTTASGSRSIAMGQSTEAKSGYETVIGSWNTDYTPNNTIGWDSDDRLFVVGNGTASDARSNAMTIMKNGRVGLQSVTSPTYALELPNNTDNGIGKARANEWTTYSDKRVKSSLKEINYGLEEILQVEPLIYFQHNSNFSDGKLVLSEEGKINIGFVAQDIYKIIPEIVNVPQNQDEDLWSVSYNKLAPVLVKAMQEQQEIIEKQNEKIDKLEKMVLELLNNK